MGIDVNHAEFQNRIKLGKSFISNNTLDYHGHGTQVSGIIASRSFGIAKNATIIPIKIVNKQGKVKGVDVIKAISYIVKQERNNRKHIKAIVNLSASGPICLLLDKAIKSATKFGLVVVTSAGNSFSTNLDSCLLSPARESSVITVTAVDPLNRIPDFAGRGKCVDIAAPGVNIPTIGINGYGIVSGTSMATAHVSGYLALILQSRDFKAVKYLKAYLLNIAVKDRLVGESRGTPNLLLNFNK